MSGTTIRTSVIIPAFRAWSTLPGVLDALSPQLSPALEVVLVESGINRCAATTVRTVCGCKNAGRGCEWSHCPTSARGMARNIGAAQAGGRLLAFLDADAIPSPDWLGRAEQALGPGAEVAAGAILNGTPQGRTGTARILRVVSAPPATNSPRTRRQPAGAKAKALLRDGWRLPRGSANRRRHRTHRAPREPCNPDFIPRGWRSPAITTSLQLVPREIGREDFPALTAWNSCLDARPDPRHAWLRIRMEPR
jgi:glycosyltransferase involved in cell wall biosynthesis